MNVTNTDFLWLIFNEVKTILFLASYLTCTEIEFPGIVRDRSAPPPKHDQLILSLEVPESHVPPGWGGGPAGSHGGPL